uniref:Ankyrin repeat and MYND domain containing 1 n=1 Tax=Saimiri boliviensis boliviensis TaxID=39432 RepID=A0A2K6TEV4_SAIBB
MDAGRTSLGFDDGASGAGSPQRPLEGKGSETPDAEELGSLQSGAVFASRDVSEASEKEEEESEGPLRVQDLKEAHLQLVQGVQEWPDGCVYRGQFGLNMKLGYGEFSWPTGETHCHNHVVSLLLDCGADVNKCSDEGLTPLSMCFLLYYPARSFKPNIAERTVPKPQEPPKLPVAPILSSFMDTNLESLNYELSQAMLEKSAQSHSLLRTASPSPRTSSSDKGTIRRMALSMLERKRRWRTIQLLLRRGADPNLCRVPVQGLFLAVKAGDTDGVRLLLERGARTDVRFPPQLGALTPLHIAAALPGEEGVRIVELLLHAITDVDAKAADEDDTYDPGRVDLLPSSLKLSNEPGPPRAYYGTHPPLPEEGGRTALHVACEREDSNKCARDIVRLLLSHRANPDLLWSGHSPLSLSIASGNDLVVKELLTQGADPNLPLTKGLGSALCVACDLTYEHQRSMDSRLALIDRLLSHGADILKPVTLRQGEKVAVGTAVDYGYFKFFQDRKIAHSPFHTLMPAEREAFVARKRLLEYMGLQLRQAVFAKESQWDPTWLYLCKRAELIPSHRMKKKSPSLPKGLDVKERKQIPFFKFCYQCGRSVGVRLLPCPRCYGILTCSKYCKTKAWAEFHKKDCGDLVAMGAYLEEVSRWREESP